MSMPSRLDFKQVGDVAVLHLVANKLDSTSFDVLTRKLYRLIDREGCKKIVLNLSDIEYFFSESVGLLVSIKKRVSQSGCDLRLCSLRPAVQDTLNLMQLDDLFEICDDEASAIRNL